MAVAKRGVPKKAVAKKAAAKKITRPRSSAENRQRDADTNAPTLSALFSHLRVAAALSTQNLDHYRALVRLADAAQRAYGRKPMNRRALARALDDFTLELDKQHPGHQHDEPGTHGPAALLIHAYLAPALIVDCLGMRDEVPHTATRFENRQCDGHNECTIEKECSVCIEKSWAHACASS